MLPHNKNIKKESKSSLENQRRAWDLPAKRHIILVRTVLLLLVLTLFAFPSHSAASGNPPDAVDDAFAVSEDSGANSLAVLANDTDLEMDTLAIDSVTQGAHGSVVITGGGTGLTYAPSANYFGPDSFTYTISDGTGTDTATVSVTVTNVNDPPDAVDDAATVAEDSGANPINVLLNDSFAPDVGETLTITGVTQGANGSVVITGGGSGLTYAPSANYFGPDSFTYTISDGNGGSDTATVNVTVTSVNDNPTAADDTATVDEDSGANVINVLANDTYLPDPLETLSITSVTPAAHGTVVITGGGTGLTYAPTANYYGADSFTYTISDGNGGTDTATVNVTVINANDDPTAVNDNATVAEDSGANAIDVLANDTYLPDPIETLRIIARTNGANGMVTITGGGTGLTYAPNLDFNGTDSFTYTLTDGNGAFASATVFVTVNSVNDAPVPVADSYSVNEDTTLTVLVGSGVLSNDSDLHGGAPGENNTPLSAAIATNATNGSLSLGADGSFTYTPNANFNGTDTFTYTARDNLGGVSTPATVTVTVNAVNDVPSFTKGSNQTVNEDSGAQSVAGWATAISKGPADEGAQTLTFFVSNNNNALFSAQPDVSSAGVLTYTSAPNANGTATVSVYLQDSGGTANGGNDTSPTQTFTITVNAVNDRPTFNLGANQTVNEDSGAQTVAGWATAMLPGPVTATDEAGQTLTFNVTGNSNPTLFSVAPAVDATTGTLTYTPAADANGTSTITLVLKDNGGTANGGLDTSVSRSFTITVNAVNDAPTLAAISNMTINEDPGLQTVNLTGIGTGAANETQALTITAVSGNTAIIPNPTVNYTSPNATGSLTFTPIANANGGPTTITVTVSDGVDTFQRTFTVTVNAVNDAPTFTKGSDQTVLEDAGPQTVNNWATAMSVGPANESTQSLTGFTVTNNTNPALFSVAPAVSLAGALTYTSAANANGSATITLVLKDNGGTANGGSDTSAPQTFTINVTPVNDAPVASFTPTTTSGTGPLSVSFTNTSSDVDNATPTLTWNWNFGDGTGTSTAQSPTYVYNKAGTFTVTLTATDPGGLSHAATGTVTVRAGISINDISVPENIGNANFTVTLSVPPVAQVTVKYDTANGSARAGWDYTGKSNQTLTIAANNTTGTITIPITNDSWVESIEDFFVNLSNPSANATITDNQGRCEITTDYKGYLSINDVTVSEGAGNATFTVTLSDDAEFDVTVQYATANNTAVAGSDFTAVSGTLTIPSGTRTATITVPIINDFTAEGTESFRVNLSNPGPYGGVLMFISDAQGIGTITDNDYSITFTKAGTATSGYNVSLSAGSVSGAPGANPVVFGTAYGFDSADTVTLTATDTYPTAGCVFKGWSGSASGGTYTTTVTMNGNKNVTATFNGTHTFTIEKTGTGAGRATVTAGAGSDSRFPGGTTAGTYLYEEGSTISLTGTQILNPTEGVTGSKFSSWAVQYGAPGAGFSSSSISTSVVISGPLSIIGNFIGRYNITSYARTGGTITPLSSTCFDYGQSQSYAMAANTGYVRSDTVIDGYSQGAMASYTFSNISNSHTIIAVFQAGSSVFVGQAAGDEQIYTASIPPMVLMVMGRDHKLYYEAYNDASDLNGDGTLDVGYNPSIDYYGYFDSYKVYRYDSNVTPPRFTPIRTTANKKIQRGAAEWSGDFLNYLTTSRMDALRKVLYGGYRVVDSPTETLLERVYVPQDAHSWGKEYQSEARDNYHISDYTPFPLPVSDTRHLFVSTSMGPNDGKPRLRVLKDSMYRIWEWVSIERPVAGPRCMFGWSGPYCETDAIAGGGHPGHPWDHTQFETLARRFGDTEATPTSPARANEMGRGPIAQINGTNNPMGGRNTDFMTLFKGELWIKTAGRYQFGVDGANAVELILDGLYRPNAGWYNDHNRNGSPGNQSTGWIFMSAGPHVVEFRHEYGSYNGPAAYTLSWRKENPGGWEHTVVPAATFGGVPSVATLTNNGGLYELYYYVYDLSVTRPESRFQPTSDPLGYEVRVQVGHSSFPESNCKMYPNGTYKPIGILQRFGEPGKLNFGLMTGSFEKNLSGGLLRKAIGPISNEINSSTGQFTSVNGIISTINKLRITQYRYSDYSYEPGAGNNWNACDNGSWITCRPMNESEIKDWGNPIAEMMFEGMRYYAARSDKTAAAATSAFDTNSGVDLALGLPYVTWDNPFVTNGACAKPFMLVLSDINPNYDSNQLPGAFSSFATTINTTLTSSDSPTVNFQAETVANGVSTDEGISGNHYIGQVGTTLDSSCSPKSMTGNGFGTTRGLCPEEPTRQGSYYAPAVAYFGRTHDMSASNGIQNVLTYVVALASPLPRIEIRASNDRLITVLPFGKSVGGGLGVRPDAAFQPTDQIVDFYIESLTPTTGMFRVNFEDVEQGADHDMDAIVIYSYQLMNDDQEPVSNPSEGTKLKISLLSQYASGGIVQHLGYIISGTSQDGTYLDVVDADVAGDYNPNSDVDYALDTPPGVYAGGNYRHMPTPLPFSSERVFSVGNSTTATLLKDPLWYAAKWGGFVDQNGNNKPDLQSEWDSDGDGDPDTYFYVVNPLKLEQQLTRTFSDIVSRGVSHVAPVVSVDEANRTQSGDKLYMAFFKPLSDNYWQGNLKKYGLDYLTRDDCGRTDPEWTVVDANSTVAGLCDGTFKSSAQSYWSTEADGASVNKGGVGARLLARQSGSNPKTPATPYYSWRNVYTYKGATDGSLVQFLHANITNSDLEVPSGSLGDLARYRIINFMYGYTYDAVSASNPDPVSKREWILGDIIHSEPKIIDYFDDSGNLTHRFIAVGANDGMLHVFTDTAGTIDGVSYQAGDEIFAFIPRNFLRRLQEFSTPSTHVTMMDGSAALYRSNTKKSVSGADYYEQTLVFGERAGGRGYWALDVTAPKPSTWKVKWQIEGGASGVTEFQELGYTWSKPYFAKLKTAASTTKEVAIFAAGYDPLEDGFPEGFDDQNKNGRRDTGEIYGVTIGGTEGYDKWNPGMDTMGRGIFVVDLSNGSLLFKAINGASDVTTGINQSYTTMMYCFPADISVIPLSDSLIIMYAADVYGQIWRIRYDYYADLGNDYTSVSSAKWTVERVFTANPGSNLTSGDAAAFTNNTQALVSTDAGRKMFYSPDVSLFGNDWTSKPVLYVGTGDRQHARYTMISNRMYYVSDTGTLADETDLLNLTCNELDADATVAADTKTALENILLNGTNSVRGSYRVLDKQGLCADDSTDHTGEHILSQPTLFFKNVYFTSYQPVFDDPCNPAGNAFIYALEYSYMASAFNYDFTNDTTETSVRKLTDTFRFISGSSIPSGVRVIMRDGTAAGLISAGGAVAGVGEDGSTTIPGPPGGITPLLWETE